MKPQYEPRLHLLQTDKILKNYNKKAALELQVFYVAAGGCLMVWH